MLLHNSNDSCYRDFLKMVINAIKIFVITAQYQVDLYSLVRITLYHLNCQTLNKLFIRISLQLSCHCHPLTCLKQLWALLQNILKIERILRIISYITSIMLIVNANVLLQIFSMQNLHGFKFHCVIDLLSKRWNLISKLSATEYYTACKTTIHGFA